MAICPHCGTNNADYYTFCMNCGKPMQAKGTPTKPPEPQEQPAAELDELLDAGIVCPRCDTYNDPGRKTCISCGESLSGLTDYLLPVSGGTPEHSAKEQTESAPSTATVPQHVSELSTSQVPQAIPETPAAPATQPVSTSPVAPTPQPASTPPVVTAPPTPQPESTSPVAPTPKPLSTPAAKASAPDANRASPVTAEIQSPAHDTDQLHSTSSGETTLCPFCQAVIAANSQVCFKCGKSLAIKQAKDLTPLDVSIRLRLVRGYGREDSTMPIGPKGITIGRSQAMVTIPQDPFLSPMHLKIFLQGDELFCQDLGSLNGTFLRTRSEEEIKQGAEFITGNQRFYLMGLGGPTTDVRINASNDTRAYGGPVPTQLFVALRLHYADEQGRPLAGAVLLRSGPVISIGKWGCDLNFPSDPAMAQHQCELHLKPSGIQLREKGTSTGVFIRIKDKQALKNGDELLLGDEVFRVEIG